MNKKLIIFVFVLTLLTTMLICNINSNPLEDARQETHYVREGETLWWIAAEYCPADMDVRDYLTEIKKLNDIQDNTIYAGDRITVLVPQK